MMPVIVLTDGCDGKDDCVEELANFLDSAEQSKHLPIVYGVLKDGFELFDLLKVPGVVSVCPDESIHLCFQKSFAELTACGDVAERMNAFNTGMTGRGVRVAVLDSGINDDIPELRGKVIHSCQVNKGNIKDDVGHGTLVASIIASNPVMTSKGLVAGVAPSVEIINVKVFDSTGDGAFSHFIRGVDRALDFQPHIISYSGGGVPHPAIIDVQDAVVDWITAQGILCVTACGNDGIQRINSPSTSLSSVSVGSVDLQGQKTNYSNYGPTTDGLVKPDVSAFGGTQQNGILGLGTATLGIGDGLGAAKGTSFSVPYITGLLAQCLEARNDFITREDFEFILSRSCSNNVKNVYTGWGVPDFQKAIILAASLSNKNQWFHGKI